MIILLLGFNQLSARFFRLAGQFVLELLLVFLELLRIFARSVIGFRESGKADREIQGTVTLVCSSDDQVVAPFQRGDIFVIDVQVGEAEIGYTDRVGQGFFRLAPSISTFMPGLNSIVGGTAIRSFFLPSVSWIVAAARTWPVVARS